MSKFYAGIKKIYLITMSRVDIAHKKYNFSIDAYFKSVGNFINFHM